MFRTALVVLVVGCTGPTGPAGQTGPQGPQGPEGPSGSLEVTELELAGSSWYPENLSASADGTLYVGSLATGVVGKFAPGEDQATSFITGLKGVAGVLVDDTTHALFVCAVDPTFMSAPTVKRYDLSSGALVATFTVPTGGFPNDLAFDSAHGLYVTDSFGGNVWKVTDLEHDGALMAWAHDALLAPANMNAFGADGISFDGANAFYVNNNDTGALLKIAVDTAAVSAVTVTPALAHPDGQRTLSATKLVVVDNAGSLFEVTLNGATAAATVVANHLDAPTGVAVVDGHYWVSEGQITSSLLTGTPPNLPFVVRRFTQY